MHVIWALLCLAPGLAFAPEGSPPAVPRASPPSLADLQREAEGANPAVLAAAARLDAARRVQPRVTASPDPEVGLTYVNDGVSGFTLGESEFTTLGLTWTQEVPYPGKLERAGAIADADVEGATAELRQARLQVRAAVGRTYADLYRIDRAAAILRETASLLDVVARSARDRYEVGAGVQENVLKAETEVLRLQAEMARLDQDRTTAVAELAAALGRDDGLPIGELTVLPDVHVPPDPEPVAAAAVASSAAVDVARAGVRRGEAVAAAADRESKPDFLWAAGYQNRGGLDPMVMGMFGMRLPIHRGRKQHLAALEAGDALRAARYDLAASQVKAASEARAVWARARRADRLVELYEKGVVVQARAAVVSAQSSYSVGRIDLLDLLNDLTVLLGVRLEAATQTAERLQAAVDLEALTGLTVVADPSDPAAGGEAR